MRDVVGSIEAEYERYHKIGEGAMGQLGVAELNQPAPGGGNSVATLVWHVAGNLASRFTDFLASDGEKPWRDRESEFAPRRVTRQELAEKWSAGWRTLFAALAPLADKDLGAMVTIRNQPLTVREALHRSLAHTSYHVGQIVLIAKSLLGAQWRYLSIPPGQSAAYNRNPGHDRPPRPPATAQTELADRLERAITGPTWHGFPLQRILADATAAEAVAHPVAGAHSIAQLVRHMTVWADVARQRLSGGATDDPVESDDWPPVETLDDAAWRRLLGDLATSYQALAAATRLLSAGELAALVKGKEHSVEDMLRGVVEHGAYHGGQAALLLRRILRR